MQLILSASLKFVIGLYRVTLPTSTNAWIASYDVFLCALDEFYEDPYHFHKRDDDEVMSCTAKAYADDLQTFSSTVAHSKAIIVIVSAFSSVTGFTATI